MDWGTDGRWVIPLLCLGMMALCWLGACRRSRCGAGHRDVHPPENKEEEAMRAILSREQEELVAIGAAIAANCEPCLRYHVRQARDAGLEDAQLRAAVTLAQKVKDTPARLLLEAADRLLQPDSSGAPEPARSGCCG